MPRDLSGGWDPCPHVSSSTVHCIFWWKGCECQIYWVCKSSNQTVAESPKAWHRLLTLRAWEWLGCAHRAERSLNSAFRSLQSWPKASSYFQRFFTRLQTCPPTRRDFSPIPNFAGYLFRCHLKRQACGPETTFGFIFVFRRAFRDYFWI